MLLLDSDFGRKHERCIFDVHLFSAVECHDKVQILRAQVSRFSNDIENERRKKAESERIRDRRVKIHSFMHPLMRTS